MGDCNPEEYLGLPVPDMAEVGVLKPVGEWLLKLKYCPPAWPVGGVMNVSKRRLDLDMPSLAIASGAGRLRKSSCCTLILDVVEAMLDDDRLRL